MNRARAAGASPASATVSTPAVSTLPGAVMSESINLPLPTESTTGTSPAPFKSPILSGLLGSLNASNNAPANPAPALSSNTTRALQKLATMSGNPRLNTMLNKHGSNPSLADELSAALGQQTPPRADSNGNSPPPARMTMSMSAADWISPLPSMSPESDAMVLRVAGMRMAGGSRDGDDEADLDRVAFDVNQNESQESLHVAGSSPSTAVLAGKRALDELCVLESSVRLNRVYFFSGHGGGFGEADAPPNLPNGHTSSQDSGTEGMYSLQKSAPGGGAVPDYSMGYWG
jgi:hypothetical protein